MALFSFGKKNDGDKDQNAGGEREYFKAMPQQQAAAPNPEHKELLRLMALDACRKVDLDQAVRSCQVVGSNRGFTLLVKTHLAAPQCGYLDPALQRVGQQRQTGRRRRGGIRVDDQHGAHEAPA